MDTKRYPDIDYLTIARPGKLRPDAVSRITTRSPNDLTSVKACNWRLRASYDR